MLPPPKGRSDQRSDHSPVVGDGVTVISQGDSSEQVTIQEKLIWAIALRFIACLGSRARLRIQA
jgi:hypothetical protein